VLHHVGDVFAYKDFGSVADWSNSPYAIYWRDENGQPRTDWTEAPSNPPANAAVWPKELLNNSFFLRQGNAFSPSGQPAGDFYSLKALATDFQYGTGYPVRDTLIRAYQYIIARYDIDGFRIDTLKYISPDFARVFEPARGEVVMRVADTAEACGFDIPVGKGRAIVISASCTADVSLFTTILEKLGVKAALRHDCPQHGIFMTSSASQDSERFLHLLNLDAFPKDVHLAENGEELFDGRTLVLGPREGLMLPLNVSFGDVRIVYATAEIVQRLERGLEFRLSQQQDIIALETDRSLVESDDYTVEVREGMTFVISRKQAAIDDQLTVRWN